MDDKTEKMKDDYTNLTEASKDHSWLCLSIATILIVLIWGAYLIALPRYCIDFHTIRACLPHGFIKNNHVDLGTLGDYFGALNCLFAGLAYASVFVSIKQQSKSINIQQKELKAQLTEMVNGVKEAKMQNALQREYQFSDELYRRINLLKLVEKDIRYNEYDGVQASIRIAGAFNSICSLVLEGDFSKAKELVKSDRKNSLTKLKLSMDTFSVWAELYRFTLEWLDEYINEIEEQRHKDVLNIKNIVEREEKKIKIDTEIVKMRNKYESILISSTIWANRYLFALHEEKKGRINKYRTLLSNPLFASGKIARNAKVEKYRKVYGFLYNIDIDDDIEKQLSAIYKKVTDVS